MTSNSTHDSEGEQAAEQLHQVVEDAIHDWLEDNSSSVHRDGDLICARESELVDKIVLVTAMTAIEFEE